MGKVVANSVLDAALNKIATATLLTICSAEPTTLTEATTTYALADVTIDSGDFTVADGDTSGRKVTIAEQVDVPVDANGTATHIALTDGSEVLYVTTISSGTQQAIATGNTITPAAWKVEIADPS